ncbi:hypothetical protein J4209_02195 [Candidatus Woesearchaeota archaeon]|nr:hypothetical protein [Candidatus Woesearchaeota archaeon]
MTKPEVILKVATDIERGKYKGTQLRFYLQRSPSETHKAYDMYHFVYFFSRTPSGLVEDLMRDVNQSGFDLEREWSLFGQNLVDGPTGIVNKDPETLEAMEAAHQMISLCPDSYRGSLENALYTRDIHTVIALAKNIPEIPIGSYN